MTYLPRALDLQLNELLPYVGAIAIDGPKGVGKQPRQNSVRQRHCT
ncbi:MAG: hypothetical protein SPK00_00825 [Corynebacterium glucuronolyticum]|nr:hypothetical protein [Mycobacteriaceae bacterium]MDY5833290.1 hypothetical protein [Corynebacterium glucuronolyticum]